LLDRGAATDPFVLACLGRMQLLEQVDSDQRVLAARSRAEAPGGHVHQYTIGRDMTVLHVAARFGHCDLVDQLLLAGADPDGRAGAGETALHFAAHEGFLGICRSVAKCRSLYHHSRFPLQWHGEGLGRECGSHLHRTTDRLRPLRVQLPSRKCRMRTARSRRVVGGWIMPTGAPPTRLAGRRERDYRLQIIALLCVPDSSRGGAWLYSFLIFRDALYDLNRARRDHEFIVKLALFIEEL